MEDEERFCAWERCGKVLIQRPDERRDLFLKRITCGQRCGGKLSSKRRVLQGTIRARTKPMCEKNQKPEVRREVDAIASEMFRQHMMRGALR